MKRAKLFLNGQSLAVRLPKEFRVKGKELYIKKQGDAIVLIPMTDNPWQAWKEALHLFSSDFLEERAQPKIQKRASL